jgi:hypothetical protein
MGRLHRKQSLCYAKWCSGAFPAAEPAARPDRHGVCIFLNGMLESGKAYDEGERGGGK